MISSPQSSTIIRRLGLIILTVLLVLLALPPAAKWMSNELLDYDEAGQFWMSKGLHHYSAPYSECGSLKDALEYNRHYNMDPGGFTAILYFWSKISNDIHFLRLLPIIFYLLSILGTYLIGKKLFSSRVWAIALALLLVLPSPSASIPYFSIPFAARAGYLRAYTMEMAGVVLCVWYLLKNHDNLTNKSLLKLSLLMCFFCTSRYGFIIAAFAMSLYVLWRIYNQKEPLIITIKKICVYSIPLLITVAAVYFGEAKYQNSGLELLPYYRALGQSAELWCGWMSVSLYLVSCYVCVQKFIRKTSVSPLYVLTCVIGWVFVVFSCLNKYPWAPLSTMPVMLLTQISLFSLLLKSFKRIPISVVYPSLLVIMLFLNLALWRIHIRAVGKYQSELDLKELKELCYESQSVLVTTGMNPTYRYLFEYGALQDVAYPASFSFCGGNMHHDDFWQIKEEADMIDYQKYTYVVIDSKLAQVVPEGFVQIGSYTCKNMQGEK